MVPTVHRGWLIVILLVGMVSGVGIAVTGQQMASEDRQRSTLVEGEETHISGGDVTSMLREGQTVTGSMNGTPRSVTYTFGAERGEAVAILTANAVSVNYTLHGPYDRRLERYHTEGPARAAFGMVAPKSGEYSLEVADGVGSYQIVFLTTSPDGFEPNDRPATAVRIGRNDRVNGTIIEGDQDWFVVDLPPNAQLDATLTVTSPAVNRDLQVEFVTPSGSTFGTVERSLSSPTNTTVYLGPNSITTAVQQGNVTDGGTYYVRVSPADLNGFSNYTLAINTSRSQ